MNFLSKIVPIFMALILTLLITKPATAAVYVHAPIGFINNAATTWKQIETILIKTTDPIIYINYEGRGGYIYLGIEFIKSVQKAQSQGKTVIIKLIGSVASMHTLALCFASNIQIVDTTAYLMYHSADQNNYRVDNTQYKWMFDECVRRGYAPRNTFDLVQAGYVVYYFPYSQKVLIEKDNRKIW